MASVMGVGLHVEDLARAESFYTTVFGMNVVARYDVAAFKEIVLSYGEDLTSPAVLLLERYDHEGPYAHGDALAKVLLIVDDVRAICDQLPEWGCAIERGPDHLPQHGKTIAIVFDPDGYRLELVQES